MIRTLGALVGAADKAERLAKARPRAAEASGMRSEAGARQNVREHKQDAKEARVANSSVYKLRKGYARGIREAIGAFLELFPACWNIIPP